MISVDFIKLTSEPIAKKNARQSKLHQTCRIYHFGQSTCRQTSESIAKRLREGKLNNMLECGTYHFVHGCDSGAVYVSHLPIPIPIRLSAFLCNAAFFFESAMLHAEIFGNHISYFTSGSQKCHISYLYLFFYLVLHTAEVQELLNHIFFSLVFFHNY